jgi:hypothetical protein
MANKSAKIKSDKIPNPYAKKITIAFRVNTNEFLDLQRRARTHTNGNVSLFVRHAAFNYGKKS